jgi:starch synthase
MPKYDCLRYEHISDIQEKPSFNWGGTNIRIYKGIVEGLHVTFLEPENGFFWVGCVYGRNDDAHRFGFFCGAALEYLRHHSEGGEPDIVHCHDWPTAPVAFGDTGKARCASYFHLVSQVPVACRICVRHA